MRSIFPKYKPGERPTRSARKLQALADAAQLADGLRPGPGMSLTRTTHGIDVRLTGRRILNPRQKSGVFICAIVAPIGDDDDTLTIREVRYLDGVFGPTDDAQLPYEFVGDSIDALPYPGHMAKDYSDLVSADDPPKVSGHYLDAITIGETTVVGDFAKSGAAVARFRIVGIGPDTIIADKLKKDGTTETAAMSIVRPWDLQRTPFDGKEYKGSRYQYIDEAARYRSYGPTFQVQEREIILPTYANGDIIHATQVGDAVSGKADHSWLDDNRSGRRWARSFA